MRLEASSSCMRVCRRNDTDAAVIASAAACMASVAILRPSCIFWSCGIMEFGLWPSDDDSSILFEVSAMTGVTNLRRQELRRRQVVLFTVRTKQRAQQIDGRRGATSSDGG